MADPELVLLMARLEQGLVELISHLGDVEARRAELEFTARVGAENYTTATRQLNSETNRADRSAAALELVHEKHAEKNKCAACRTESIASGWADIHLCASCGHRVGEPFRGHR